LLGSLLQACGGGGGGPGPSNIKSITIDPVNPSIAAGTTVQLHATANFKNKTTKDITESVTWVSADTEVTSISNAAGRRGLASAAGAGATTVKVKFKGKNGTSRFTVTQTTLKSITLEPPNPVIAKGTTVQLSAFGHFSDGSAQDLTTQVSWSSGNPGIAQVSDASPTKGLVTGVTVGNTPITVTLNGSQGSTTVTVTAATLNSITFTPLNPSIATGTTVQLIATCNFSDGTTQDCTTQVGWTSANDSIATVSTASGTQGLVTGAGTGSTSITATLGGISGSILVTVTAATLTSITLAPVNPVIANGTTVRLTATANFSDGTTQDFTTQVSWTSAADATAQVSNVSGTQGVVSGLSVGSTAITATLNGIQGSTTVTVTAAALAGLTITAPAASIAKGTSLPLTATGNFTDGTTQDLTTQVSWTSADSTIVQVSNASGTQGVVTGINIGSTPISATLNGTSGSASVTVTAATLTALTITVPAASIAKGTTFPLTATGNFTDGTTQDLTTQVSWTSADSTIVQVSNASGTQGVVTGINIGSTPISATLNGISGSAPVTVTAATLTALTITVPAASIAKGTTFPLTATGNFTDGTTQDLTTQVSWTSADNTIAQVSNVLGSEGVVTGINIGTTSIIATLNGIQGSAPVTVTAATLTALTITVPAASIAKGTTFPLTATGNFTDGTTQDLTTQVGWTSADNTIVQVSNASGTEGVVTGINIGSTPIAASLNGISGSASVSVTAASLIALTIHAPSASIAQGTTFPLTATGNFTDGTTQDLTTQVSWTSADNTIVQVSNASGTEGVVTGINLGSTPITASLNSVSGSAPVTVTAATLVALTIHVPVTSIAKGTTFPLTATGNFTDGTTQDLTTQVSWTSADNTIVQVSNASGTEGVVTGINIGSTLINATLNGITGSGTVTVTAATLTSIVVAPSPSSIAKGATESLTATGVYTDLTTQDLTAQVSWTSADNTIAQVSNVSGSNGLVTGLGVGSTSITATLNGTAGSATVTVTPAVLSSISVTPGSSSIAKGTTVKLTATGNYSDGSTQDLTTQASWTSTDNTVAQVANVSGSNGLVTGLGVGSTSIIATFNGTSGSATVTVTAATLSSISVTPGSSSIAKGTTVKLTATGSYSDGSTQDLTSQVSWTSAGNTVAQVSNVSGSNGLVTGLGVGSTSITATLNGTSGSATVTVTAATLTQLVVTPTNPTLSSQGTTKLQMTATATFSDGSTQDVTQQANWTSSDDTVAHIISSSSTQTNGELQAKKPGTTTITATFGGLVGSTVVTVTP
jgi:uncharacterized protein YjdB